MYEALIPFCHSICFEIFKMPMIKMFGHRTLGGGVSEPGKIAQISISCASDLVSLTPSLNVNICVDQQCMRHLFHFSCASDLLVSLSSIFIIVGTGWRTPMQASLVGRDEGAKEEPDEDYFVGWRLLCISKLWILYELRVVCKTFDTCHYICISIGL
jgi:hypothetical protein